MGPRGVVSELARRSIVRPMDSWSIRKGSRHRGTASCRGGRLSQRAGVALPSPPTAQGEFKQELSKHRDLLYPTTPKEADVKLDAGNLTFASM